MLYLLHLYGTKKDTHLTQDGMPLRLLLFNFYKGKAVVVIKFMFAMLFALVLIMAIVFILEPMFFDIVVASLTGEESSASTRGDMVHDFYLQLLSTPWGNGLGTGTIDGDGGNIAESSILLQAYEIGIQGCAFYLFLWFVLLKKMRQYKTEIYLIMSSLMIATLMVSVVSCSTLYAIPSGKPLDISSISSLQSFAT